MQFGGYLIVRLYDILLPGRKPLAGDPLQQKKQKKVEKQQFVWPRLKKGGGVPETAPGRRVMEKTDRKIPSQLRGR